MAAVWRGLGRRWWVGGVGGGVNTARTNKQVHIFDLQHAPHREDLNGWTLSESKYHVLYHCLLIPVTFFFFLLFIAKVKAKTCEELERADNLGTVGWPSTSSESARPRVKVSCVETKFQNQADDKSSQFNRHERLFVVVYFFIFP